MIDSKLMTTESLTLARGKDWGHRWWWRWLWEVWLIVRLLMKRSEILKTSELICGHDSDGMIPKLSWDIVHLSLMIWTGPWRTSFLSPPALIDWVTFTTTIRTYLMPFSFTFPTLTLILIPWPRLTWPCGPLTFSFWFCLSFWLSLWLPLALLRLILRRTFALRLTFWFLLFSFSLFAYLIHWILLGGLAADVKLIDLLCLWWDAVVEVVDEKIVNVIPCWLLSDAEW